MITTLIILGYIISVILSYGILFAHFQREHPILAVKEKRNDMEVSLLIALIGGPIALFTSFLLSGFAKHGLKFY